MNVRCRVRRSGMVALAVRVVAVLAVLVAALPAPSGAAAASPSAGASSTSYYLALGDSLAQGVQPDARGKSVETNQGYADDLWAHYHALNPALRLAKLGCPGETTGTMINGGICTYARGSQLAQAMGFLATHHVALVTIDIGANDIDSCVSAAGLDRPCVTAGFAAARRELPMIVSALRQAAPSVPILAMNYYDPFVVAALKGGAFVRLAVQSELLGVQFNQQLSAAYRAQGIKVADVQSAFAPLYTPATPYLGLPVDIALGCAFTWMCAPAPVGPNIHATPLGYSVIADVFGRTIG